MDAFPLEVGSHGVRVGVLRVGGCICRGGVVGWKALISLTRVRVVVCSSLAPGSRITWLGSIDLQCTVLVLSLFHERFLDSHLSYKMSSTATWTKPMIPRPCLELLCVATLASCWADDAVGSHAVYLGATQLNLGRCLSTGAASRGLSRGLFSCLVGFPVCYVPELEDASPTLVGFIWRSYRVPAFHTGHVRRVHPICGRRMCRSQHLHALWFGCIRRWIYGHAMPLSR